MKNTLAVVLTVVALLLAWRLVYSVSTIQHTINSRPTLDQLDTERRLAGRK